MHLANNTYQTNIQPRHDGKGSAVAKDFFGITLNYYNWDYTRENTYLETGFPGGQNQYNGNAKSVSWKIPEQSRHGNLANPHIYLPTETQVWAYKYNYNDKNWLTNASFGRHDIINSTFNSANYYSVSGIDYDKNGNLTHLNRAGYGDDLQMDELHYSYSNRNSNKLSTVSDLFTHPNHLNDIKYGPHNYTYNHIGQLTAINSANHKDRYLTYNGYGNMKEVFVDNASNATALQKIAEYTYNDLGYRSGKDVNIPGKEIQKTRYIYDINGNVMAIYFADVDNDYRLLEQPVYGSGRIGTFLFGSQKYFYELTDHLGSVRAIVSRDEQGEIEVNEYADYYPYGMPMPGRRLTSPGNYRYGYQGQFAEEDDETGYNSFELRTYDPRIGRWLSCDPMGQYASPYVGMGNNPVNGVDPDGGWFGLPDKYFDENGEYLGDDKDPNSHLIRIINRKEWEELTKNGSISPWEIRESLQNAPTLMDKYVEGYPIESISNIFSYFDKRCTNFVFQNPTENHRIAGSYGAASSYNDYLSGIKKIYINTNRFTDLKNGFNNYYDVKFFLNHENMHLWQYSIFKGMGLNDIRAFEQVMEVQATMHNIKNKDFNKASKNYQSSEMNYFKDQYYNSPNLMFPK